MEIIDTPLGQVIERAGKVVTIPRGNLLHNLTDLHITGIGKCLFDVPEVGFKGDGSAGHIQLPGRKLHGFQHQFIFDVMAA